MLVETTRLMDRWLKGPMGVAMHLPLVPKATPEGGNDPEPVVPTIYNDTEDESVVGRLEPDKSPALVVFVDGPARAGSRERNRVITTSLTLIVVYITRDVPALVATRDGAYVLRAVKQSLMAYNSERNSSEYRRLNGIKILSVDDISHDRVLMNVGPSELWGFVRANLSVIED